MVLRRAAAAPEDVRAGEDLMMKPGDAFIAPAETTSEYASDTSTMPRLLSWLLVDEPLYRQVHPGSWREHSFDYRDGLRPRA
jgi:hypothetical protein